MINWTSSKLKTFALQKETKQNTVKRTKERSDRNICKTYIHQRPCIQNKELLQLNNKKTNFKWPEDLTLH